MTLLLVLQSLIPSREARLILRGTTGLSRGCHAPVTACDLRAGARLKALEIAHIELMSRTDNLG